MTNKFRTLLKSFVFCLFFVFPFLSFAQSSLGTSSTTVSNTPPSITPAPSAPKTDLLFILDSSGSMRSILDGSTMIDWAKKAISSAVLSLPSEAEVGLRVYAHRVEQSNKEASCKDSELLVPIHSGQNSLIASAVQQIKPKGWTPIAYSLEQAANDFVGKAERLHTIILISDGEETCGGDPVAAARSLIQKGYRVIINTVGFNVDEKAKNQLKSLAQEFGGTYTDIRGGANLQQELTKLTEQSFLIEKKETKNRIRGGDGFQTAVPIEVGKRYALDHHQRKNEFDYFTFTLNPGQGASLAAFPVPKCLTIVGNEIKERETKYCFPEGFRFVITDKTQKELERLSSSSVDTPVESRLTLKPLLNTPESYYLIVGSPTVDMHKDVEFMLVAKETPQDLTTQTVGDVNSGRDAGDTFETAILIEPNLYDNNSVSKTDLMDMFKLLVPQGSVLKVVVGNKTIASSIYNDIGFEVLGELGEVLGGKRNIYVGTSGSFESRPFTKAQPVYIRIKKEYVSSSVEALIYSLGISLQPSSEIATPQVTTPTTGEPSPSKLLQLPGSSPQGRFSKELIIVTLIYFVLMIACLLFFLWKKQKTVSRFAKILAGYEIAASAIGTGVGVYLVSSLTPLWIQTFLLVLFLVVGGLGMIAGGMFLSGRALKPSFWWAWIQIPWISLNLHWIFLTYNCSLLLGFPIYFLVSLAERLSFNLGFHLNLGADLNVSGGLIYPGEGFEIGLGLNLIPILFLILLIIYRRKEKRSQGTIPPLSS